MKAACARLSLRRSIATDRALELVSDGVPFRDAYQEIGRSLQDLGARDPAEAIAKKRSTGSTGNLRLDIPRAQAADHIAWTEREEKLRDVKIGELAGRPVELFRDPLKWKQGRATSPAVAPRGPAAYL